MMFGELADKLLQSPVNEAKNDSNKFKASSVEFYAHAAQAEGKYVDVVDHDKTVDFDYEIVVEYASWGISGIRVKFDDTAKVGITLESGKEDGEESDVESEDIVVEVPLSKCSVNVADDQESSSLRVHGLDISVDADGKFVSGEISVTIPRTVGIN